MCNAELISATHVTTASTCQACDAPIRWARTERGAAMPINLEPDLLGNLRLHGQMAITVSGEVRKALIAAGHTLYKSHFATCPFAKRFKSR